MVTWPGQIIDMFRAINEETLWEVSEYFSSRPQAWTHTGAKIKQSPRLKLVVLRLDVLEDVAKTGELCRCPGHEVGEASCLVKIYRGPLAPAITSLFSPPKLVLFQLCVYPEFFSKYSSLLSIFGSGSSLSMYSNENSFFILSSTEALLAFFSASSKGTTKNEKNIDNNSYYIKMCCSTFSMFNEFC